MPDRPTALITGASRGIGRATALRLARTHDVIAVARTEEALDTLAAEIAERGGRCQTITVDVASPPAVAEALDGLDVDVLVNNAGVGALKPFLELTAEEWHRMVDVNFNALFHVTRAVLPGMVKRESGHVVMIGSIAGRSAFVGGACYAATKHAVTGFAECLMLEVRDAGVRVSVVNPGSVSTGFTDRHRDVPWQLVADDVAAAVEYVVGTPPGVLVHGLEVRALSPKRPRGDAPSP
jgi:3-oxoacyl-[acyl-carrier protein] reductase